MRTMRVILTMSVILLGAALVRGVTYMLTHALGIAPAGTDLHAAER